MPDFNVIADVSTTLESVLKQALKPLQATAEVSDLEGNISHDPPRITIFLFETVEDPMTKNRPRSITAAPNPPDLRRKKPPMALLLRYMMTPWGGDSVTEHRILGRTLQVLYDDAVLSGLELQGPTLANTNQALKVTLSPITLEERARVWYAIQKPYRLSVTYELRVVNLDSETFDTLPPVGERAIGHLGPNAAQPGAVS